MIITKEYNNRIAAMLNFAAVKDVRYYLKGLCFEQTKGVLRVIATNGAVLGVTVLATEQEGDDFQMIMPSEFVLTMTKYKFVYELEFGEKFIVTQNGNVSTVLPIDGKFPDWRRVAVFYDIEETPSFFDVTYLKTIYKASEKIGAKGDFQLSQHGVGSGMFTICDEICSIIMPLRNTPANQNVFSSIIGV